MMRPRIRDTESYAWGVLLALCLFIAAVFFFWIKPVAGEAAPAAQPVIGVWYQPMSSFPKWKARGVNTLIGCELEGGNVTCDQWCAAAQAAGLSYFLQRGPDSDRHAADAACRGWLMQDEPNSGGARTADQIKADGAAAKAIVNKPVMVNLDGPAMRWQDDTVIKPYCDAADLLTLDYYPINRGEGADGINQVGYGIDRLKRLSGGKSVYAFVETSNQNLIVQGWPPPTARGPTLAEEQAEVAMIAAHGGDGIEIFPDVIGRNFEAFDGTPDAIAAAMPILWTPYWRSAPIPPPSIPPPATQPATQTITVTVTVPAGAASVNVSSGK